MKKKFSLQADGTGEATQNIWVTTYGDMMTNLMILFMVMWTYTQFLHKDIANPAMPMPNATKQQILRVELKKELQAVGTVLMTKRKVIVTLPSAVLFDPGSEELKATALEPLDRVADALAKSTAPIVVEGHTDDIPITHSHWRSNYELSAARAFSVIRYFTEVKGLPPSRLAARGYGPYRPTVANDSDESRARNRRIEIHLWTS
ncbi:MAG TPA: flagellar motor protein MotB [Elusimicrobiota bacterium]|nr:flagellar motor protein MotB [Elusimicrobiota bacterium]